MHLVEPVVASWKAELSLGFARENEKTVLAEKRFEGPLVVQKALYPEGPGVCHAIVVHPPGGIAGGDDLHIAVGVKVRSSALLTTPGAAKWYRSAGPWAKQGLSFEINGILEWLPRETIVFDGALASLENKIVLRNESTYIGWEIICLGRRGSGERFRRGQLKMDTRIYRDEKPLWIERGGFHGDGALMRSPAGLAGRAVLGTLIAASSGLSKDLVSKCRDGMNDATAMTLLPGVLLARYLGDSGEEAFQCFTRLWQVLRPALIGKTAIAPRIWST
jgi:urease accessory protein